MFDEEEDDDIDLFGMKSIWTTYFMLLELSVQEHENKKSRFRFVYVFIEGFSAASIPLPKSRDY